MFTTETAVDEPETKVPPRRPPPADGTAGPPANKLALLTDPAWLVATLWNRKGLILLAALVGALLAALASLAIPPKYVSTAQLFIDPRDLRVLQNEVSPNAAGGDPTSITSYLESQARIISSDSIKSRVILSEGLDKDPEFGGEAAKTGLAALFADLFPSEGAPPREGLLYALAALDKNVSIRRGERTFVIDISVTSREATKAARIANALANAYLEDQAAVRADAAQRATQALTSRLEELRNRLRVAEDKAERYKEANNLVGLGGTRSLTEEQLTLSTGQLSALRTRAAEAKAKYDQIAGTRAANLEAGAIPEAVASNTMTALRSQLGAALAREADLTASLGARHPSLTAARAQVADARRQIGDELGRIRQAARAEYDRAVEAERDVSRRTEQLTKGQQAASRASVELRELEREVESTRVVYDAFLRRARETGELAGIDTTNARVIGVAMPPLEKSGVSRRTVTMAGAVLGGGAGCALALALALFGMPRLPRRRPAAADVAPAEPVAAAPAAPEPPPPVAVAIAPPPPPPPAPAPVSAPPPVAPAPSAKRGWRHLVAIQGGQAEPKPAPAPKLASAAFTAEAPMLATVPVVRHRRWRRQGEEARSVFQGKAHLVDVLDKPKASFAASIRKLRLALAGEGAPSGHRSILVLGLHPAAGASTIALNLALDAAITGLPAMLVDSGLGAGGLTPAFAPEAHAGLHEIANGTAALARVALQDEGTGLFFLPRAGQVERVDAEQIRSGFLAGTRRFGPIVIDGAALGSDALTGQFALAVDDIVLVLREGGADADAFARADAILGSAAAKIRGFVVNQA